MKVLCYGVRDVEKPFFESLNEKYNFDITCVEQYLNTEQTAMLAEGFECVILRGNCFADKKNLDIYKSLGVKYILTRTVGINHIDIQYAKSLGFKLAYVPFYSPNAIAELALTHALMLSRNMAYTVNEMSNKDFRVKSNMFAKEVRKSTVGIIGLGKIGLTTAKLFKGIGANVLGYDVYPKENIDDILTQVSLNELIENSDIISLHIPYIKENGKLVTKEFLSKMKKGSILINTGRGEVVDTLALIDSIKSGHLRGAGLDTIDNETNIFFKDLRDKEIEDETLKQLVSLYPNVILSPHIGSFTDEAVINMIETSYQNLDDFIKTGNCKNEI